MQEFPLADAYGSEPRIGREHAIAVVAISAMDGCRVAGLAFFVEGLADQPRDRLDHARGRSDRLGQGVEAAIPASAPTDPFGGAGRHPPRRRRDSVHNCAVRSVGERSRMVSWIGVVRTKAPPCKEGPGRALGCLEIVSAELKRSRHRPAPPPGLPTRVFYGRPGGGAGRCRFSVAENNSKSRRPAGRFRYFDSSPEVG